MFSLLERHTIQKLKKIGATQKVIRKVTGISERTIYRIQKEPPGTVANASVSFIASLFSLTFTLIILLIISSLSAGTKAVIVSEIIAAIISGNHINQISKSIS